MKTPDGWEPFAKFFIGNLAEEARDIFSMLKGAKTLEDKYPLTIDFMETIDELPVNLDMINCSLSQLAENTIIITKELFRLHL
ncbi:MAG TPA: hypothetical protein VM101_00130 [Flavitalea sp.]|nr:hypothetical protein [Flavitalea sp.]